MAQKRNPQMEELLSAHLARRDEPNFALGNAISTYLAIPSLLSFYPCSSEHIAGGVAYLDDIASDYDLVFSDSTGSTMFGFENLVPTIIFDGTNYVSYADDQQFDVSGASVVVEYPGITVGAWVKFDSEDSAENILAKYNAGANERAYRLWKDASNQINFIISSDGGAANVDTIASTDVLEDDVWYFAVGRWNASTTDVWVDKNKTSVASTRAGIHNSSTAFRLASEGGGLNQLDGRLSLVFITSSSLSDSIIRNLYEQSRYLFNK